MNKFYGLKRDSLEDRGFVFNLYREELVKLLTDLNSNTNGGTLVLKRRVMDLGRHATEEQAKVFQEWKERRETAGSQVFQAWINGISVEERKEVLEALYIEPAPNEEENLQTLRTIFSNPGEELKKEWLVFAQEFYNTLGPDNNPVGEEESPDNPNDRNQNNQCGNNNCHHGNWYCGQEEESSNDEEERQDSSKSLHCYKGCLNEP